MTIDIEELKRLAQAATQGPWRASLDGPGEEGWVMGPNGASHYLATGYEGEMAAKDVRLIAAANPAAVLALIERVEELEQVREQLVDRARRAEESAKWNEPRAAERNDFARRLVKAESERDALRGRLDDVERHAALLTDWSQATTEAVLGERPKGVMVATTLDAVKALNSRVATLEALARKGLEAYHHGEACPFAFSTRPGNPSECEHADCREWAAALEAK